MRPLSLTLSGLHSYRDPVTIDFADLGRYGLFGIFGKIGSGKSTILDAMTLALFGVVDRVATRARQGLIHLGAERCEVRFAFDLAGDVYEVQRSYREVEGVAQRIASRVVAVDGAHRTTLADKETEVNQTVSELIGLGADDFTRAVVLPQGKFQQLLHLRGQERRLMLQRIFHLQAYGEGLRRQVRDRKDEAARALASLEGELAGLGDASDEAVRAADAAAIEARRLRNAAERAMEAIQAEHDAAARAREQHHRHLQARHALEAHLATRAEHEARAARLDEAERLRPLLAPAERWLTATDRADAAEAEAASARRDADAAAADLAPARAAWETLRAEHAARDPARRARLSRLQQLEADERDLAADRARADADAAEISAGEARLAAAEQALAELRAAAGGVEAERKRLRREHNQVRVPPAEREALALAVRSAERVSTARARAEEAQHERQAAQQARDAALREVSGAEEALGALRAALDEATARLEVAEADPDLLAPEAREALLGELAERGRRAAERSAAEREITRIHEVLERTEVAKAEAERDRAGAEADLEAARAILAGAERAFAEAEEALAQATRRVALADLAGRLAPGEPCPVCGAREHPAPSRSAPDPHRVLLAAVEAHRAGRAQARAKVDDALTRAARAEAAQHNVRQEIVQAEGELAVAIAAFTAHQDTPTSEAAEAALAAHDRAVGRATAAREALRQLELDLERRSAPVVAARARLDAAEAQLARAALTQGARAAEAGEAWAAFDRERGAYTLLALGSAQVALENRDRRTEQLHEQLEAVDGRIHALELDIAAARDAVGSTRSAVERARQRAETLAERISARATALQSELGDASAATLAAALRAEMDDAADRLSAVQSAAEAAAALLDEARRRHDAAGAEARAAAAERDTAANALHQAAARAGHPRPDRATAEGWLAASPDAATVAAWRAEVEAWRDQALVLEARLAAVTTAGDCPDDETFASLTARLEAAGDAAERARAAAIGATRHHEELASKAERYRQLGERAASVGREATQLDTLANVLRGDRFVEFVANDHLSDLTTRASQHLELLSDGRYRLGLDDDLSFVVRDREHGDAGVRPVHSLSGGETFLASLALALALSEQVQQRTARPLGFFFLDEGFGTLDPDAIDRVLTAIERLRDDSRLIGLISHVAEIRERVPRYLWVHRDEGGGSRVEVCAGST